MQKNLPYVFFLLAFSSCTKYQYGTISSNATKGPDSVYLFENDSVQIKYSVKGEDCPLNISIFNKLSVPLYVDWRKSSVIINGKSFPVWTDQAEIQAYTTKYSASLYDVTNGSMTRPESISFVPPQSYISMKPVTLRSNFFKLDRKTSKKTIIQSPTIAARGFEYAFQKEASPLAFRSFLAIAADESFRSPLYVEHHFWVSHVLETTLSPTSKPLSENQFVTEKLTGTGSVMSVLLAGGILLLVYAVEAQ
jgi:hypothetical protein